MRIELVDPETGGPLQIVDEKGRTIRAQGSRSGQLHSPHHRRTISHGTLGSFSTAMVVSDIHAHEELSQ